MKIACLATSRVPSRSANSIRVVKVCQALVERGHRVTLWVPGSGRGPDLQEVRRQYALRAEFEIRTTPAWPPLRRWDFSMRAVAEATRWGPELWYVWPYQAAAQLSTAGRRVILEVHDRPAGIAGPVLFRLFLRGRGARRLLVITRALRDWLAEHYPIPDDEGFVRITPSGVDLSAYEDLPDPAEARARLGWPEGFTAGYTGHLYPGRGLDLMVELARRNPEIRFVWAGGEAEAVREWSERIAREEIANLRLLGFVAQPELPLVQSACDVLLMPYDRSIAVSSGGDTAAFASPMKAFEYMACARPILASRLPVFLEVLHPDNSVLLEPGRLDAWDSALRRLAGDPTERRRLAESARRDAGRYSWAERTRQALEGLEERAR